MVFSWTSACVCVWKKKNEVGWIGRGEWEELGEERHHQNMLYEKLFSGKQKEKHFLPLPPQEVCLRCRRDGLSVTSTSFCSRGPGLSPSTQVEALNWNSSSRVSSTFFWPLWSPGMNVIHRHTWRQTHIEVKNSKNLVCLRERGYLKNATGPNWADNTEAISRQIEWK